MAISSSSREQFSSEIHPYHARPPAEWGRFWEGCVLWIRTKESIDRYKPSLTQGLQMDIWVYDHPCVVLSLYKHPNNGQIVQVAPVCSTKSPRCLSLKSQC
jgi:hypothetical protein